MKEKTELKPCPHCGNTAKFATQSEWPYMTEIIFCPSCLAKGPHAIDYETAAMAWNCRLGFKHPAAKTAISKACPYCAGEDLVEGNNGLGNEPGHEGTLYFAACPDCRGRGPHVRDEGGVVAAWNKRVDG